MSTRSVIGILHKDGTIDAHYCHSDGYWSWNGRILFESYQDRAKIQKLIDLGAQSVLQPELGEKHDFDWRSKMQKRADESYEDFFARQDADPRAQMSRFYGRDRGEKDVGTTFYSSIEDLVSEGATEQYLYLWDESREAWIGCATPYRAESPAAFDWHLLSDLAEADWKDGRDDKGNNPTVPIIPLFDRPVAANDAEPVEDERARAIF